MATCLFICLSILALILTAWSESSYQIELLLSSGVGLTGVLLYFILLFIDTRNKQEVFGLWSDEDLLQHTCTVGSTGNREPVDDNK
jgi:Ca2+/H+ antiporter